MTKSQKTKAVPKVSRLSAAKQVFRSNGPILTVLLVWLAVMLVLSFLKVAAATTVQALSLSDYEVGQIADRTIHAEHTIVSDEKYPFSVSKGEVLIKKGFPITEEQFHRLEKVSNSRVYMDIRAFLNDIIFYLLLAAFIWYLFSKSFFGRPLTVREGIFLSVCTVFLYVTAAYGFRLEFFSNTFVLPVILPASFFIILVTLLFGQSVAVYYCFIMCFVILNATDYTPVPALFELASCLFAVRIVHGVERRFDMVIGAIVIALLDAVFMLAFYLIFSKENLVVIPILSGVAFNGFLSGILALGFITPIELLLNTASIFRLMDLSDMNTPILRQLLLKAPGTYNHSMMVATLAESACSKIGANALLARVGAYYHDIGKMDQPEYFVENQTMGINIHDSMNNPRLSLSVIRSHVKKGVEKANQLRLPQEVIDIIAEHHGNSVVSYFYNEAKKLDENVQPEDYSYIGNPPHSKEAAVVMLADTAEAACRTLKNPSAPRIEKFLKDLFQSKIEHSQMERANLTFSDLTDIRAAFLTILAGYYHTRIEYPDQKDPDQGASPAAPGNGGASAGQSEAAPGAAGKPDGAESAAK